MSEKPLSNSERVAAPKKSTGWLSVAVDYGPLVVFLTTYLWLKPEGDESVGQVFAVSVGTGAFMVAAIIALAISQWRLGKISPMLWLSTVMIVVFGAITVISGDQRWIQAKPTVVYIIFGLALLFGWFRGRGLLKVLLESAFEGLSDRGWLLLSRNWGFFFIALSILNEVLVATLTFPNWLWAKLWVFMPLTFLFTFSQIPMLMKHGLSLDDAKQDAEVPPPAT